MKDQMEVGALSRGVILLLSATPIRLITKRPWLSPSSFTRRPMSLLYIKPSQREDDGLTTFRYGDKMG
jgi:hypothetical protein